MRDKIFIKIVLFFLIAAGFCLPQTNEHKNQIFQRDKFYPVERLALQKKKERPKNIILMIGDGMSLSIMYTAWVANHGHLNIDNCRYVGLSKTYSANKLITDSGAGATAFATGYKTNNHSVGVDAAGHAHPSILEIAKGHNLSTGLIATCNILDATPSAFIAKTNDRDKWDEIAQQYTSSNVDFVFGGGRKFFKNGKDGKDLTKELAHKGYHLPITMQELQKVKEGKVFALMTDDNLPAPAERGDELSGAAMKAIELLSQNENGFFLMIEGSMIDDRAHENNLELVIDETLDFDHAIGDVLKWASDNGETLVIITADHETGGLTLLDGDISSGRVECSFSTEGHSGVMVPVYSFGPGAENYSGIFENTDLYNKMIRAYGFNDE